MAREYGVIEGASWEKPSCVKICKDLGAAMKWRDRQYEEGEVEELDVLIMQRIDGGEWSTEY